MMLAHRLYSASYCSISALDIRYLENSPSKLVVKLVAELDTEDDTIVVLLVLLVAKLGILDAEVKTWLELSKMTPASTRNSLALGSKFSRLDE